MSRFKAHTPLEPVFSTGGRALLHPQHDGPVFRGGGDSNYVCPHCGHVLAESVMDSHIFDIVIQCNACDGLAEFERLPPGAVASGYVFVPARPYKLGDTIELKAKSLIIGEGAITGGGSPLWN
jgi:hypothetical protein